MSHIGIYPFCLMRKGKIVEILKKRKKNERMDFLNERILLHRRQLPIPLTDQSEEFSSPDYQPFYELKRNLIKQQKELSGLDIVEWHKSTARLHPAGSTLRRLRDEYYKPGLILNFYALVAENEV